MKPLLIIRPEPGGSATLAAAQAAGLEAAAWPLFEVRACPWDAPDPATIDGVLLGSANAVRCAGPQLAMFRGLKAHAVGAATLAAACGQGLAPGVVGENGLQSVINALPPGPLHLLRLAGADHVPLVLPPHVTLTTCITYRVEPVPLPAELAASLHSGAVVLLHSAAAARHFGSEVDRLGVPRTAVALAALGPRIAAAAGPGWAACAVSDRPEDGALLALATKMCH